MYLFIAGANFCMALLEVAMLLGVEIGEPAEYKAVIFLGIMMFNFWCYYDELKGKLQRGVK